MKNILVSAAIASVFMFAQAGTGFAAWGDGPGCGLGKMLFEKEPKSILLQHIGSTSNVPSQPFGISSGTSGCTNNGMIVKEKQTVIFASLTYDSLSQEMAQGHGEHLVSLATLLGVPSDQQPKFFSLAQDHYRDLMQTGNVSPQAMVAALEEAIADQAILPSTSKNPLMLLGKGDR